MSKLFTSLAMALVVGVAVCQFATPDQSSDRVPLDEYRSIHVGAAATCVATCVPVAPAAACRTVACAAPTGLGLELNCKGTTVSNTGTGDACVGALVAVSCIPHNDRMCAVQTDCVVFWEDLIANPICKSSGAKPVGIYTTGCSRVL